MPRRSSVRDQSLQISPPPQHQTSSPPPSSSEHLALLRTQWKWAAFSQFFFTFHILFPMNDISLNDIEDDLVRGFSVVLPRIMQRLLYTLSYDRKVSLDNWQTALRKQYRKRDPAANPIGPEPRAPSPKPRSISPALDEGDPLVTENVIVPDLDENKPDPSIQSEFQPHPDANANADPYTDAEIHPSEFTRASTLELDRALSLGASTKGLSMQPSEPDSLQIPSGRLGDYTEEQGESKDWLELPMLTKLDSMHLVTEWQFHNPTRLRTLMRSDNDDASWRIEPIGYDSKKNAYWLIGADRLWIQRPIPRLRPPKSKPKPKPKPKPNATLNYKAKDKPSISQSNSLKRKWGADPPPPSPSKYSSKRPRLQDSPPSPKSQSTLDTLSGTGRGRAAKAQANLKLNAQAKELEELNRQAAALVRSQSTLRSSRRGQMISSLSVDNCATDVISRKGKVRDRAMGTRISARLRGCTREVDEGEWQAVPQEWLAGEEGEKMNDGKEKEEEDWLHDAAVKTGLEREGSEVSDLTELSEENESAADNDEDGEDDHSEVLTGGEEEEEIAQDVKQEEVLETKPVDDKGFEGTSVLPEGFIEWETMCVTLYEWEHIAERFSKATHYLEKALYKVLVNVIVPEVTEELREIERKKRLSLAVTQRKRSSRLLLRQSEREEAEAAARKLAEEEERHSRTRRAEARQRKEEADRERRETARETRRREREERERMASVEVDDKAKESSLKDSHVHLDVLGGGIVSHRLHPTKPLTNGALLDSRYHHNGNGHLVAATPTTGSGSRTPAGDDWELDCEICHRHGINLDDGTPMMSCGLCSKWQHIACHDRADQQAGRSRRNWDVVEFFCLKCRAHRAGVTFPKAEGSSRGLGASTGRSAGGVQSSMSMGGDQLDPTPYLGHGGTKYGGVNSNPYMGAVGSQPALQPAPVDGSSGSYTREQHVSNVRSAPSLSGPGIHARQRQRQQHVPQHQSHPPQQQPYGAATTIAFSHYQPQQRGFSSSPLQQQYNASGHTQPYGHHAINTLSGQPGQHTISNGSSQSYQQQTSQTRWNVTTPAAQRASSFSTTPYAGVTSTANISSAVGHYEHHDQRSTRASLHVPAAQEQTQAQWQHFNRLPLLVEPQPASLQHQQQVQHPSQFRYHPTSYQSPTS